MSYWIVQSISGTSLFFTEILATTANFQDGLGDVYCDGAAKLFPFRSGNSSKKGGICIAETAIKLNINGQVYSIQNVISGMVNSSYFRQFLSSDGCTDAESIFNYVCAYIKRNDLFGIIESIMSVPPLWNPIKERYNWIIHTSP